MRNLLLGLLLAAMAQPLVAHQHQRQVGSLAHLPSLAGDYFVLPSRQVGRSFHIYVRLPEGYDDRPDERYPVVYLLDGDSTFPMLAPQHLLMTYDDGLPEAILVGIAYGGFGPDVNKRGYDFRMSMEDGSEGGGAAFQDMLENELLPEIDRRYRTIPARRVLVGQSRGGSAVLQAAWEKPEMFWGFVSSNPGYEEPSGKLYGVGLPTPEAPRKGWLILASGSADRPNLRERAFEWRDVVASRNDLPWDTRFVDIEGGTHAADLGRAYRAAMRLMFGPVPEEP